MLAAKNISKILSGKEIIKGITLHVNPGNAIAIVGPNGAGKSVLIRAVSLIDPPTSGDLSIDSRSFSFPFWDDASNPPPWPEMTVVFQQLFMWPHLTLRQNVILPLRNSSSHEDGMSHLECLVRLFQLRDVIDHRPNQASVGQCQLAALIRALVLRPKWLILDEVTSALDTEQTQRVLRLLQQLKEQGSTGIIFVTHLLGFAAALADEILFLDGGQILERGGPQILTGPRTARMKAFVHLVESLENSSKTRVLHRDRSTS